MENSSPSSQAISLSQLNHEIKHVLKEHFLKAAWVVAEISELKINASGHCYLELIEKNQANDKILAKARANIWAYSFRLLKPYFETTTLRSLEAGIKIMFYAQVEFHEIYGLSLNITDIDPTYTLGDIARQRAEAIAKLKKEGVFDMNRNLELPIVVQKIAIISSSTAAGYQDFCKHLLDNEYGFYFKLKLYPSLMQGEAAVESMIAALEKINSHSERYHCVVIIRGGGSQSDLGVFDHYWLASNVAQFPLPILTGIGHEQDESVTDLVAHTSLKTPTAVADFILAKSVEVEGYLQELKSQFTDFVMHRLSDENSKLMVISIKFGPRLKSILQRKGKQLTSHYTSILLDWQKFKRNTASKLAFLNMQSNISLQSHLSRSVQKLNFISGRLRPLVRGYFKTHNTDINNFNELIESLKPENILKRGFSITYHYGKALRDASVINPGDLIESRLEKGLLKSKITGLEKYPKEDG
jgi:exodeoxyribonuclease VII large subunit